MPENNSEAESLVRHNGGGNIEDPQRISDRKRKTLDGGYSWAVFGCVFWIYFLTGGIIRSSGVLYKHLVVQFKLERSEAAWPSTVMTFFLCAVYPFAVIFKKSLSNRLLCFVACLIASIAFMLCYVTTTIVTLTILLGIMFGTSMGIIAYIPASLVPDYFCQFQDAVYAAVSIAAPVGGVILPPLVELVVTKTGLHHFLFYFGCLLLTAVIASFVLDTPSWKKSEDNSEEATENQTLNDSFKYIPPQTKDDEDSPKTTKFETSTETLQTSTEFYNTCQEYSYLNQTVYYDCVPQNDSVNQSLPNGHVIPGEASAQKIPNGYQQENGGKQNVPRERGQTTSRRKSVMVQHLNTVREILGSPMFWLILVSQMVFMWAFEIYLLVIMDYSCDLGLPRQNASFILSATSAADILARLTTKSLSKVAKRRTMTGLSAFAMGLICCFAAVSSNIHFVVAVSVAFGVLAGILGTNCILAYADYIGIDKFSFILGVAQFIVGIPHIFRPLLIGAFRDSLGSYVGLFYMNGAFGMVAGLLWFFEPFILRKQRSYEEK